LRDLGIVAPHEHTLVLDHGVLGSKRDDVREAETLARGDERNGQDARLRG
jgi:hypothetical protein